MAGEGFKRKLSAILSADVAGYSRLMGQDDDATVRTLTGNREMMSTLIKQYQGRVVDSPGDNLLAEFESVLLGVNCAVEIQRESAERNADLPEERRMEYRIGVNLGDVIQEGDRIYGDGVNIAARLEALAEPGGICISGIVYSQVKNRLKLEYEYLGEQTVKNIRDPVPVYRILSTPKAIIRPNGKDDQSSPFSDKPSIAVLPFANISGDLEQEYFSDGMTEELISALANLEGLKVISRTSSFYFKGKDVDLRTVGEKLKVDNVIEGSVRKAGNRLRITAQLIQVADDTHLWSETYNREIEDIFAIQEEISNAIVDKLKVQILGKEKEPIVKTHTTNMDAYESFIKGRHFYYSFKEGGMEKAIKYYQQALTFDPHYAPAYSAIAEWYCILPFAGGQGASKDDVYTEAKEAINKALEIDDNLPDAHATLGLIKFAYEWDWKGAEDAFETALDLNPGSSKSHYDYALFLQAVGNFEKSVLEAQKAIELDPLSGNAHYTFGLSLLNSGQIDQAIEKLRYAQEILPKHLPSIRALGQAYAKKGMLHEAITEVKKGLNLFPKEAWLQSEKGYICALMGEREMTQAILNELLERSKKEYVPSFAIALLHAVLGKMDQSFQYLEKCYEKREIIAYPGIKESPLSLLLRTDPRFIAFLKKMGLEP